MYPEDVAGAIRLNVTRDDFICVVTAISITLEHDDSTRSRIPHLVDLFLNGVSVPGSAAKLCTRG